MACKPCERRAQQRKYKVVTASGSVVYRTDSLRAAQRISGNYKGAQVQDREGNVQNGQA